MIRNILTLIFFFFSTIQISRLEGSQSFDLTSENGFNDANMDLNGEFRFLSNYLSTGPKVVFDVGANVGEWSLCALKTSPLSKIYAFEPTPYIFRVLEKNTKGKNISCFNYAICKEDGYSNFYLYNNPCEDDFSGCNSIYERSILKNEYNRKTKKILIQTKSLDDLCDKRNIKEIDFLKIDTEGNEYNILLGAKNLLAKGSIKVVQFEYGGTFIDAHTYLKDCFYYLKNLDYKIFRILPTGLLQIDDWDDRLENYAYSNYVGIKNDHLKLVPSSAFR